MTIKQDKQAEIELLDKLVDMDSYAFESGLEDRLKQIDRISRRLSPGGLVLDAGCGPGTYGIILAQHGYRVIGVDISTSAVRVAGERAGEKRIDFSGVVGDLEELPFEDNSFDICFCGYTLHHFPDIGSVVGEFARVVKPGGCIVIFEPNGSNPVVKFSKVLENIVQGWLFKLGVDSPNEALHRHNVYTEILENKGFQQIRLGSSCIGGLPPLPARSRKSLALRFIRTLAYCRRFVYVVGAAILPGPLNGFDLVIMAEKGGKG
jgi:ubiquinone/menaquinone biosynthesis C-methylase UbiE